MPRLLTRIDGLDRLWLHPIAPPSELKDPNDAASDNPKKTASSEPKLEAEDSPNTGNG